jgi:hypothetical protein
VNKSAALISSAKKFYPQDSATPNATAGAAVKRRPLKEWLRGPCQYLISHLHTEPGSGDGTLEPCNLRVLSAPITIETRATTEQ